MIQFNIQATELRNIKNAKNVFKYAVKDYRTCLCVHLIIPDDDDLTYIKLHIMNLGDEYGSYCLIKRCAIQGHCGPYRQHEACHPFVHVEILFQTAESDG